MIIDCHSILARWRRNHFCQLLNFHGPDGVRQIEIHTIESLVPESSAFEIEMAIETLKRHESPGIDHIAAELIKAVVVEQFFPRYVNILILFGIRRNCLKSGRSLIIGPIYKKGDKRIVVIIELHHFGQVRTKCHPTSCIKVNSICRGN